MKKLLITLLLTHALAVRGGARSRKAAGESCRHSNQPALTIYNQNFFVAREYVPLDLTAGVNHAQFAGIASHLEPDSVILRDPAGRSLQVLEQNYRNDPDLAGTAALVLRRQDDRLPGAARRQTGNHQRENRPQRIHSQQLLCAKLSAAVVHATHHRSRWRAALRTARPAAVPSALRRFRPEADSELAVSRPTIPANSTPRSPTSPAA